MGKNNRQRRADKRRHRTRTQGAQRDATIAFLDERDLAEIMWFEAAEAAERGDDDRLEAVLRQQRDRGGCALVALTGCLVAGLRDAWEGGWQPADVARAAAKRLGGAHAELAAEMITLDAGNSAGPGVAVPETWAAQLRELVRRPRSDQERYTEPDGLRVGAALLGMLTHLIVLPQLIAPPSRWGRRHQPPPGPAAPEAGGRMLEKVRALLAKAESTDFEEEADALTAKAQQLMARHAIDHAMLGGTARGEVPSGRRIGIDDPYAQGKAGLLATVAAANRCRAVWMAGYGFSTVVGFPADLEVVEVLYTSLLVQATRALTAAGPVRDRAGRSQTRSFRQSFLIAFAGRIGERLQAAAMAATEEATETHGRRLLPVLAERNTAVDDAFEAMFPHLTQNSARISNSAGWAAGRTAADLAHLGPDQQLLPGIAV